MSHLKDYANQLQEKSTHLKQRLNNLTINTNDNQIISSHLNSKSPSITNQSFNLSSQKSPVSVLGKQANNEINDFRKDLRNSISHKQFLGSDYSIQRQNILSTQPQQQIQSSQLQQNSTSNQKSQLQVQQESIQQLLKNTGLNSSQNNQQQEQQQSQKQKALQQVGGLDLFSKNLNQYRQLQLNKSQQNNILAKDDFKSTLNKTQPQDNNVQEKETKNQINTSRFGSISQEFKLNHVDKKPNKNSESQQYSSFNIKENLQNLFNTDHEDLFQNEKSLSQNLQQIKKNRAERPYSIGSNNQSRSLLQSSNFVQKLDRENFKITNNIETPRQIENKKLEFGNWSPLKKSNNNVANNIEEIISVEKLIKLQDIIQKAQKEEISNLNQNYARELSKLASIIQNKVKISAHYYDII